MFWAAAAAAILLTAGVFSALLKSRNPENVDRVQWVSIAEAEKEFQKGGKPILYEFSSEWCGPCQAMKREVFGDKATADWINLHFIPVKLVDRTREDGGNRSEVRELQQKYQIQQIPTIIVRLPHGSFGTNIGFQGLEAIRRYLQEQLDEFNRQIQGKG